MVKEKVENDGVCKTSKRERKKKFVHIKDSLHKTFGKKNYSGIGNGSSRNCSLCGKRIIKGKYINEKWICENCY